VVFLPIVPLKTLLVPGIDESTLGARAAAVAKPLGVQPIPALRGSGLSPFFT
jgi:hypothetical protein